MSNGILSQEEINALMNSNRDTEETPAFTHVELDALGEITNISMGSAATALSTLLGRKVSITAPHVELLTQGEFQNREATDSFIAVVDFVKGFQGSSVFVLSKRDSGIIVDLLLGGDGTNPPEEFNEIHLSGIAEAMNQMMGSAATSMSTMLNRIVDISPPKVSEFTQEGLNAVFTEAPPQAVYISFQLSVEGLIESALSQLIPVAVARDMVMGQLSEVRQNFVGTGSSSPSPVQEAAASTGSSSAASANINPQVTVQPVQFAPFQPVQSRTEINNLDLIMDVPVQISVELGKTQKTIRQILDFVPGSIVELDKLAGESVDLIANGKLLARGEVVVINENFGIRITEIVNPLEKVRITN